MDTRCSLRDISIFVAAYEERSFTAAAERENATQSGVSGTYGGLVDAVEGPPVVGGALHAARAPRASVDSVSLDVSMGAQGGEMGPSVRAE